MKFKVSERVRSRYGTGKVVFADKDVSQRLLVEHDDWHCGHNGNSFRETQKLNLIGNRCYWFSEHELTNICNQKVIITTDGYSVTARLKEGGNGLEKAVAKCNPQDTFNFEVGAKLAFERLFTPTVKEVK